MTKPGLVTVIVWTLLTLALVIRPSREVVLDVISAKGGRRRVACFLYIILTAVAVVLIVQYAFSLFDSGDDQPRPPQPIALPATLNDHTGAVWALAWSPDGVYVASGGNDKVVRVWDVYTGNTAAVLQEHTEPVWSLCWSPSGRLASCSSDRSIRLWEVSEQKELAALTGHTNLVSAVSWSPDGKHIASASYDSRVLVWDADSKKQAQVLDDQLGGVLSIAWSPDGAKLASGGSDGHVLVWEFASGTVVIDWQPAPGTAVKQVAWSPSGANLAVIAAREIHIYSVQSGGVLNTLTAGQDTFNAVAWSPDSQRLVSGSDNGVLHVWDVVSGAQAEALDLGDVPITAVAWSPDGQILASGSQDGVVQLREAP